jgi:DNA repair photolyase
VPTAVLAAPMIPGLNDAEMETILQAAAKAGARHAGYILLRLPHELKTIFINWLQEHFPDRAGRVLELIRQTRAGALNDSRFGRRFSGTGVYADLLARRFGQAMKQLGLQDSDALDGSRFAVPAAARGGTAAAQMSLF